MAAACGGGPRFEHDEPEAVAALNAALASGEGLQTLKELRARYPNSFEVQLEYARRAASAGNNAQAIEVFEALAEDDPTSATVARKLAALCLFVGQLERAAAPIGALMAEDPAPADLVLAARLAHARGDLKDAEALTQRALAAAPDDNSAHFVLAQVLFDGDDPGSEAVRDELLAALLGDPGLAEAHYALGTWYLQAGDEAAGGRQLEAATLVDELTSKAFLDAPAKERMQRAYQIGARLPTWSAPMLEVARAELELGRPKKAEASLGRAAKLVPQTPERHKLLFAAAKARGEEALAAERFEAWRRARLEDG